MLVPEKDLTFRIVLDEPVAYLGNYNGTSLVRGEVIVNFPKDTRIRGPIGLAFEGIQTVHPWFDLMDRPVSGKPIETKLHLIELSLLPPNAQGIMPRGIQRFPFEFPIPGSLPITILIPARLNIFYRVTATLQRTFEEERHAWMDWSRFSKKSKLMSTAYLRLVRAIEAIPSLIPPQDVRSYRIQAQEPDETITVQDNTHRRRRSNLDNCYGISQDADSVLSDSSLLYTEQQQHLGLGLDEQYDRLAYSMTGRTVDNFNQPLSGLEHGVRYQIGIDRTAIAIGTSLGIQVQVEPIRNDIKIRSVVVRISETRDYSIKVPGDYFAQDGKPQMRKATDTVTMVMKLAHGYGAEDEIRGCASGSKGPNGKGATKVMTGLSQKYLHQRCRPPCPDETQTNGGFKGLSPGDRPLSWEQDYRRESDSGDEETGDPSNSKLLNLKELNEPIHVGEYFDGSFVMLVPSCTQMLRPTMVHDSVSISHWLYLDVIIESNGKGYKLTMGTPVRLLDCRLVAPNDERQTILPPPPSYEEAKSHPSSNNNSTDIWIQRWPITQSALWGACSLCPCRIKKLPKNKDLLPAKSQRAWDAPPSYTR